MKTTLRIPDPLFDALRRASEEEGRSINATAIDALWRGLGLPPEQLDLVSMLGSFVARPATKTYDPEAFAKARAVFAGEAEGLIEALEWSRSED